MFQTDKDLMTAQVAENVAQLQSKTDSIMDSTRTALHDQAQNIDSVGDVFNFLGTIFKTLIEG